MRDTMNQACELWKTISDEEDLSSPQLSTGNELFRNITISWLSYFRFLIEDCLQSQLFRDTLIGNIYALLNALTRSFNQCPSVFFDMLVFTVIFILEMFA